MHWKDGHFRPDQVVVAVARPFGRADELRTFRPGSPPTELPVLVT